MINDMTSLGELFDDAHRRVCIAKQQKRTDRAAIWTGLGFPSHFKAAIKAGLFKPVFKETPKVDNWYTFTEAGWTEYDRRYAGAPDWFAKRKEG